MTGGSQGLWSFPRRRMWRAVVSGVFACALGANACGGGQPAARGFGSTQIQPIRDSTLVLEGEQSPGVVVYGTGGPGGGAPASANYWTLNLSTGAVQDYGSQYPPSPSSTPTPPSPYTCTAVGSLNTGMVTLQIVDNDTGAETDVDVLSYAQCPGPDGNLVAVVAAPSGFQLSMGPFTQLTPVPLALQIADVDWWSFDRVTGAPTAVTVHAASPSAPEELGVYTVDLGSFSITENIPPVPASVGWASGATAAGSLQSTAVRPAYIVLLGDHYLYSRAMSDGGFTEFAGPYPTGATSDLALFQIPAQGTLSFPYAASGTPSADGSYQSFPPLYDWQVTNAVGPDSELLVWDDADRQVIHCPSSPTLLAGLRSSDGSRVLYVTPQACCQYLGSGPLILLTRGSSQGNATCTLLAASNVVTAAFSPDGSAMYWLVQPATGDTQLWAAAGDGSGAHMIGAGLMQNVHFVVPGEAQLELILNGDLVWLDLHESAVQLHYIAEKVFEEIYDIGVGGWLITGYEYSTQAGTATVGLVNRNTGEKRPISPDVSQFIVLAVRTGPDGGLFPDSTAVSALTVVYVVRGRNPSPQDGIWSATITTADLQ